MKKGTANPGMRRTWIIVLILIVVVVGIWAISANQKNKDSTALTAQVSTTEAPTEKPTAAPTEEKAEEMGDETIQSKYIKLQILPECAEYIEYEQQVNGEVVSDLFSMRIGDVSTPVFAIEFGDENAGDWLGMLSVDDQEIPITYTVRMITDEELETLGEGAVEGYSKMLNCFNYIVDGIYANSSFSASRQMNLGEKQENVMTYWTVSLPAEMTWHETNENGHYQAEFTGNICGENIALYRVCIGGEAADSVLGTFEIDDVEQTVSVECYELSERPNWTEDDYSAAYLMMDTINDVIGQIMSSEAFSISEPTAESGQ